MQYIQLITGTVIHYFEEDSFEGTDRLHIKTGYINSSSGYIESLNIEIPLHQIVMRWETK